MLKEFEIFSPVKIDIEEKAFKITVWEREYIFENSFLPVQIVTKGCEILREPMDIVPVFDGKEMKWENFQYEVTTETEEAVTVICSAKTENVIANVTLVFEFDGLIDVSFKLVPYGWYPDRVDVVPRIQKAYLKANIKPEYAKLMHYWHTADTSILTKPEINNKAVEDCTLPFKPFVWFGMEYGGVGFCMESEKNLILNDRNNYCNVKENGEIVFHLLDDIPEEWKGKADDWEDALMPVCIDFMIQATPVKKLPDNMTDHNKKFHIYRMDLPDEGGYCSEYNYEQARKFAEAGGKYIIPHSDWSVYENYGLAKNEEQFKKFVDYCHSVGLKVLPYFGFEYSTLVPEFAKNSNRYLNKNAKGHFVGGWQRSYSFMQRCYIACYNNEYSDEIIGQVEYAMDTYGVDGIYTDGTYVPWQCANTSHGCGYYDKNGELKPTFPVKSVREFVKKLFISVHKRGGIIDTHQSSCCLTPTLAFADSYFDGEHIQSQLSKDVEYLNLDAFRTEYTGLTMGLPLTFISYTSDHFPVSGLCALSLAHNVFPGIRRIEEIEYLGTLYKVFDENNLTNENWKPYWEKQNCSCDNKKVIISSYDTEDGEVILVSNFSEENEILVKADTNALNLITGETVNSENGYLKLNINKCNFAICKLK